MSGEKLTLTCLVWPDDQPDEHVVDFDIDNYKTVAALKDMIKDNYPNRLAHTDASNLVIWKCSISVNEKETLSSVRFDATDTRLHRLPASCLISEHFATGLPRKTIHILLEVPTLHLSSGFGCLQRLHTYLWGKDRVNVISEAGKSYSTIDLKPFRLQLNAHPDNILLVRDEYILAYDAILATTRFQPVEEELWRSATLVTGQRGIGKTLFLFYILARRLQERGTVALQINPAEFALFDGDGVSLHSSTTGSVPTGAWALSDSSGKHHDLCSAFKQPCSHLIHTSSPASHHWKGWVKHLSAKQYIMDVWPLEEVRTLLTILNLNVQDGEALFRKFGPSPRVIIEILNDPTQEDAYVREVLLGATNLATEFSTVFLKAENLNFSSGIPSTIFTVRPDLSHSRRPVLHIPTQYLSGVLGLAMCRQAAAQQHTFFDMLSGHPSLRTAAGWLFKHYTHVYFSNPTNRRIQAYLRNNPNPHLIPAPAKIITGSKLKATKPPHNFYWRPQEPNFEGVDSVIRNGNNVWALQFTISAFHRSATSGLTKVFDSMNYTSNVKWHLVMIGSEQGDAESARDHQKLEGRWKGIPIYACELPLGKFTVHDYKNLEDALNSDNDMDQGDSDVPMN